jgi:hypothetical protein
MRPARPSVCGGPSVAILLALGVAACEDPPTLARRVAELGLRLPPVVDLPLAEQSPSSTRLAVITARDGVTTVKVTAWTHADADAAARELAEQQTMLRSLFEPRVPPYPEFLTNESGCPKEFLPRVVAHPLGKVFLLQAGERLGFGVCVADLARYRAAVAFLQCPHHARAFRVEIFLPMTAAWDELTRVSDAITCAEE